MDRRKILVIEDDEDILELIRYNLAREGYDIITSPDGDQGYEKAKSENPTLILLDLMLPGMDGLEVCRLLKYNRSTSEIPIIMVTAKGEETDIVTGLELGADDYIAKPFAPKVLVARVRACLRRKTQPPAGDSLPMTFGDLIIDSGRHEVKIGDEPINLTPTEFKILHYLASHRGWVFTRYQIVDAIKGESYVVTDRTIDVQVASLRKKLGPSGQLIETVRGIGYRFKELS